MDAIFAGCHKKNPEYYNQLGCSRNSTLEQITAEYRVRVRNCHPDKVGDAGNSSFVSLQKAFETLSNPQRRSVYDMWLDSPLQLEFEDFLKNSQALKMSMHWITPKETPQITIPVDEVSTPKTQWNDSPYSFDGLLVVALLFISSCAYLKRIPRVNSFLLSEKKGFFGVFYKAAVIGPHTFWLFANMVQNKLKQKTTLPKGVKQKVKKEKSKGPKRGHNVYIAPKKQNLIQQDKVEAEVSRVINEKNEDMLKGRADTAVGRNQKD